MKNIEVPIDLKKMVVSCLNDLGHPLQGDLYMVRDYDGRLTLVADQGSVSTDVFEKLKEKLQPWLQNRVKPSDLGSAFQILKDESERVPENAFSLYWSERLPHLSTWFESDISLDIRSKVLTFYSYKGGVGRSTLAAAVAFELSSRNRKVVLIDADLEAPGVPWYFYPREIFSDESNPVRYGPGLVDYLGFEHINYLNGSNLGVSLKNQFLFGDDQDYPNLHLLASGNTNEMMPYAKNVARLNFAGHSKLALKKLIEEIDDEVRPDYIIFDSRTGLTDIGGLLTQGLSDLSVFVGYPDYQSSNGLSFFSASLKLSKDAEGNVLVPALWVHSPAFSRDGAVDAVEHQNFKALVLQSLSSLANEDRRIIAELLENEGEDGLLFAIPFEEDLRALLRTRGIKSLRNKPLLWQEVRSISNRIESFLLDKGSETTQGSFGLFEERQDSNDFFDILKELKEDDERFLSSAEDMLKEDVKKDFFPLRNYRLIFDSKRFLILGNKGTGKTTLEKMLSFFKSTEEQEQLAKAFSAVGKPASFIKKWLTVIDDSNQRAFKTVFDTLREAHVEDFDKIWSLIICHTLKTGGPLTPNHIYQIAEDANRMSAVDVNRELDQSISAQPEARFLTFDRLDDTFLDTAVRKKALSSLINLWWLIQKSSQTVFGKVFCRHDLFRVDVDHPNKNHMQSQFAFHLEWTFQEIEAAMIKRLVSRSPKLASFLEQKLKQPIPNQEVFGYMPDASNEKWLNDAFRLVFGERITQAFAEQFFKRYLRDGQNEYYPRFAFAFLQRLIAHSNPSDKSVFDTYKAIKPVYWELTQDHLENDFLVMYKELKPICTAIQTDSAKVKGLLKEGRGFRSFLDEVLESEDVKDIYKDLKSKGYPIPDSGSAVIQRMMDTGMMVTVPSEKRDVSTLKLPDMYRVPLGISLVNGLPPKPNPKS